MRVESGRLVMWESGKRKVEETGWRKGMSVDGGGAGRRHDLNGCPVDR